MPYCLMNWMLLWGIHLCIWGETFENKLRSNCPSVRLERFHERIWLLWRRQWLRQKNWLLKLPGSWRNRRKKRKQRKEKEKLPLIATASSENSSSTRRSVKKQAKDLKKSKSKISRLLRKIEWKTYLSPSPNSGKRNLFPRRSWLVVILKRQLAVKVFPRGRNLSPKRNPLVTLKNQKISESPRKRGNSLPRWSHSAGGLKRLLPARAVAPRKRKSSKRYPRKVRMDISLVGYNLQRSFPTRPLRPNKNKNKFKRKKKERLDSVTHLGGWGSGEWLNRTQGLFSPTSEMLKVGIPGLDKVIRDPGSYPSALSSSALASIPKFPHSPSWQLVLQSSSVHSSLTSEESR